MARIDRCEKCRDEVQGMTRSQKYCAECGLLQKFRRFGVATQAQCDCLICGSKFLRIDDNRSTCGKEACTPHPTGPRGNCVGCNEDAPRMIEGDLELCRGCASKPNYRVHLIKRLTERQQERILANDGAPDERVEPAI